MKHNRLRRGLDRVLVFALTLAMVLGCMTVTALAAPGGAASSGTHVLEASALTPFGEKDKKDGDTETVGGYFTLLYSEKTKIDSSDKTWDDGYASGQRINFGGKMSLEKNAVRFATSGAASVKIWWVSGGDDRQIAIMDGTGEIAAKTSSASVKNEKYLSTLELTEGGTYFLGGDTGNNYIFKVEVTEAGAAKDYVLEAVPFGEADKADAAPEKAGTDNYFTIVWGNKGKVDTSSAKFDDGYAPGYRINFGGKSTADTDRVIKFTTSGAAEVKIWWVCGDKDRNVAIFDGSGTQIFKTTDGTEKNKAVITSTSLDKAGSYTVSCPDGTCYIFKIQVTEGGGAKAPRAAWADVALPAIKSVKVDGGDILVTVTGEVGYDAADLVTVAMLDPDGWQLKAQSSMKEAGEHQFTFSPSATGKYTFSVTATRDGERAAHRSAKNETVSFSLPLAAPVLKYAANSGSGSVTVEWNAVAEAEGYIVKADTKTVTATDTKAVIEGLTVGQKVTVSVAATRGRDTGAASTVDVTVAENAETAWAFAAFGTSTNTKDNGYEKTEDGIRVYSLNGKGKVQPSAEDGLAFYYTAIDPKTTNFVLSATANVTSWTYSNGQDGFGLIAMDQVGVNGSTAPVWSNSYMAGVSGFSYTAEDGSKINMRLGVGSLARTGVTEYTATAPDDYAGTWRTLDTSGVGTGIRNLVGNCTNASSVPGETISPALTQFKLKIEKNNSGYFISYTDQNGETHTNGYYDPDALSYVDDYVYVGLFAARNADITFTDVSFTTSDAATDPAPEAGDKEKVEPSYDFADSGVSNAAAYTLGFKANADGTVVIKDSDGAELYKGEVKAGVRQDIDVTLASGENKFTATMTPDPEYVPSKLSVLSSYETKTVEHTVTYKTYSASTIYVSPNGKAGAAGTRTDPMTLAEAVMWPAPGTKIVLLAGTYNLSQGVTIQRGINGTQSKPITLTADGSARPVLDWGEKGNGLRLAADWWVLSGFDSTGSTAKGVHVGGSHNVVERVRVYGNLNTGLSISRVNFGDTIEDWPSYNTIKNCSAYLNADAGYEDADGFEAKLTCGVGNVFDGCIAAYNADDGWDLFARGGAIGAVTVKNSVAFKNGWILDEAGREIAAGNGNGFKMGGGNIPVDHKLVNSISFANKANGITCNSNPNLKIENCTAIGNGSANVTLYTNIASLDTDFAVTGLVSYMGGAADNVSGQGKQVKTAYLNGTNHYSGHSSGFDVEDSWFKSVNADEAIKTISRNSDGTINMNGYAQLTDKAPAGSGARFSGKQSHTFTDITEDTWYSAAAERVAALGYIKGVDGGRFDPNGKLQRGMTVTIIHRIANTPAAKDKAGYSDVSSGAYYAAAADWANENGVMLGSYGAFRPTDSITRQELAVALYRYAKLAGKNTDLKDVPMTAFTDTNSVASWAKEAVEWAVKAGIIKGSDGKINPNGTATRAEAAVMISRFIDLK